VPSENGATYTEDFRPPLPEGTNQPSFVSALGQDLLNFSYRREALEKRLSNPPELRNKSGAYWCHILRRREIPGSPAGTCPVSELHTDRSAVTRILGRTFLAIDCLFDCVDPNRNIDRDLRKASVLRNREMDILTHGTSLAAVGVIAPPTLEPHCPQLGVQIG